MSEFSRGQRVLVSDDNSHWSPAIYGYYRPDSIRHGDIGDFVHDATVDGNGFPTGWKFCKAVDEEVVTESDQVLGSKSDGSTADYYELPDGCSQLQDLISHRNLNAQDGEIFRAIYRKGRASHSDELRDAKKVLFYAQAEVQRLEALS